MAARSQVKGWTEMADPPKLSTQQWNFVGLLGVVLIVMAVLQAISFNDFADWLNSIGLGAENVWAVGLIAAEVLAAVGLFKLPLMAGFRMFSGLLALLVAGFWFIQNLRLISDGAAGQLPSSGLFGGFLEQTPGWWTVIMVTVLLLWTAYSVRLTSWTK